MGIRNAVQRLGVGGQSIDAARVAWETAKEAEREALGEYEKVRKLSPSTLVEAALLLEAEVRHLEAQDAVCGAAWRLAQALDATDPYLPRYDDLLTGIRMAREQGQDLQRQAHAAFARAARLHDEAREAHRAVSASRAANGLPRPLPFPSDETDLTARIKSGAPPLPFNERLNNKRRELRDLQLAAEQVERKRDEAIEHARRRVEQDKEDSALRAKEAEKAWARQEGENEQRRSSEASLLDGWRERAGKLRSSMFGR